MKKLVASVVALAVFAGFAAAETKIDAAKIVGKWELTKTTGDVPKGTVVEFLKDGKLAIVIEEDGKKTNLGGTYKVDGDKLTVKISFNGKDLPEDTDTIKTLTDDELVTVDKEKKETAFKKKK